MKDKLLPIIAIVCSVAAVGFNLVRGPESDDRKSAEQLELRIARLEARLAQQQAANNGAGRKLSSLTTTDELPIAGESLGVADLRERQDELEAYLNQLGVFEHFEGFKQKISDAHGVAMDSGRSEKERIEALAVLREAGRIDGDVVTSMLGVWDQSFEEGKGGGFTRYYLLENLEGVDDLSLRDAILEWLPEEESAKMRARGIETLAPMRADPTVDEWLVHLSESDPEPKVQQMAAEIRSRGPEAEK